eukprot:6191533-Pleurochrysis_carterae.AAC.1
MRMRRSAQMNAALLFPNLERFHRSLLEKASKPMSCVILHRTAADYPPKRPKTPNMSGRPVSQAQCAQIESSHADIDEVVERVSTALSKIDAMQVLSNEASSTFETL